MRSKLELVNLAFGHLAEPTVLELGGDPPPPNVQKALTQLPTALDDVLSSAPWLCAMESRTLALMTPPPQGWGDWRTPHRFELPRECLRLWHVEDGHLFGWAKGVHVGVGGAVTDVVKATEATPLNVDLILRRPPEALPPLLFTAVSYELAARLAGPIKGDEGKAAKLREARDDAIRRAEGVEIHETGGQGDMLGASEGPLATARREAMGS